jgi:hypothetical protein
VRGYQPCRLLEVDFTGKLLDFIHRAPPGVKSTHVRHCTVDAKGSKSDVALPPVKPKNPVPPKETTLESIDYLVIDGEKIRFENNHPLWKLPEGTILRGSKISVFNGSLAKTLFPKEIDGQGKPLGSIEKNAWLEDIKTNVLTPLNITFRGLNPTITPYVVNDMKPSGITLPIEGSACMEHVIKLSMDMTVSFWLDSSKDYVLRRIRKLRQQKLIEQVDINYRQSDGFGLVPASWVINRFSPEGTVRTTNKVEVLKLQINDSHPSEQFEIEFPLETFVVDKRTNKEYRVQSDGRMRELSEDGKELPGSVLQPGDSWYWRNKWLLLGLACIVGVVGFQYWLRRNKARSS